MTVYDVFSNHGLGPDAPVDYTAPLASGLTARTFDPGALAPATTYWFGVRARDDVTGLSESNVDVIKIVIDANGNDVTNRPLPPQHVTATPKADGSLRVEWSFPWRSTAGPRPTGFRVYVGTGLAPDYATIVGTAAYREGQQYFRATVTGLAGGVPLKVGVRAYRGTIEETNTIAVTATPNNSPPASVDDAVITGTSQS